MSHNPSPHSTGPYGDARDPKGHWNPALRPDFDEQPNPSFPLSNLSRNPTEDSNEDIAPATKHLPPPAPPVLFESLDSQETTFIAHESELPGKSASGKGVDISQALEHGQDPRPPRQQQWDDPDELDLPFFGGLSERGQGLAASGAAASYDLVDRKSQTSAEVNLRLPWTNSTRRRIDYDEDELPSDQDDERLDPAWGIKRNDTSYILAQASRSNSFPEFSIDANSLRQGHETRLPTTEVESIMQQIESEPAEELQPIVTISPPPQDIRDTSFDNGYHGETFEDREASFFDNNAAKIDTSQMPDNAEARFDEGMPLVATRSESPNKTNGTGQDDGWFGTTSESVQDDPEPSFFDHPEVDHKDAAKMPRPMDRKATSEVLQTLHFFSDDQPDSPVGLVRDRIVPRGEDGSEKSPLVDRNIVDQSIENQNVAEPPKLEEENISALWQAALDDDDFLIEDTDELLPDSSSSFLDSLRAEGSSFPEPDSNVTDSRSSFNGLAPSNNTSSMDPIAQRSVNLYAPHQPSTSDLTQVSSGTYGSLGLRQQGFPLQSFNNTVFRQPQRPAAPQQAQSFADRAKDGYKSPYDLPLEISKPRRRAQAPQPLPAPKQPPPPPRSSSMVSEIHTASHAGRLQSPFSPTNTTFPSIGRPATAQGLPPSSSMSPPGRKAPENVAKPKPSSSSFFEELPIAPRSRAPTVPDRYTPQQTGPILPSQLPPRSLPPQSLPPQTQTQMPIVSTPAPQPSSDPYAQYQLQGPERLDPYAQVPLQRPAAQLATSNRYSPVPPPSQAGSRPTSTRYSPAPPPQPNNTPSEYRYHSQPAAVANPPANSMQSQPRVASQPSSVPPQIASVHSFQPRTSSPLAFRRTSVESPQALIGPTSGSRSGPSSPQSQRSQSQYQPQQPNKSYATGSYGPVSQPRSSSESAPVRSIAEYSSPANSYAPAAPGPGFAPPRRSQTQSPGKQAPLSSSSRSTTETIQRPASVQDHAPSIHPPTAFNNFPPPRTSVRQRGLSQNLTFIQPTDGLQIDELQRWKGSPIFRFGFGGSVVSSFPKHIPRYSTGLTMPMIKPTAGEVQLRSAKEILPISDNISKFPGPLRSKSKKKEVLSWLLEKISAFESNVALPGNNLQQLPDPRKRYEEKILLWKTVAAIVEHDGALERNTDVLKSMNSILSPELFNLDDATATQYSVGGDLTGIYRPAGSATRADTIDPAAVESMRKNLLRGEREKAVWSAVDSRLWAHAMLISSTLERSIWKQVVQEFVKQEVKVIGANTESLAALYEIFAGNLEESVDELVPPSARAGLQMVSKVEGAGPVKNALDGLDRWRETLGLVLNNPSPEDTQALAALGRLLASYGRVEASHICFLFARSATQPIIFSGADDAQASIVLLGADHRNQPFDFFRDEDAVLLTEVYEFATSVLSSNSSIAPMPHLQVFKLQRATTLAEAGFKVESQAYCDAIGGSLKSTTKLSPYYHAQFFAQLDELARRLQQAPAETSSSWISKPSMGKVSGSVWNKFSSFVAGEDSDAGSNGSGKDANHEFGPFAKVTATPALSRSGSGSDLYGPYNVSASQPVPNTVAGSRYAPSGLFTARSPLELQGQSFPESQRSPPSAPPNSVHRQPSYEPSSLYEPNSSYEQPQYGSSYTATSNHPAAPVTSINRYQATPPPTSYIPTTQPEEQVQSSYTHQDFDSYIPTPPPEMLHISSHTLAPSSAPEDHLRVDATPTFGGYTSSQQPEGALSSQVEPIGELSSQPAPYSFNYEPPSDSGYVPYQPDPESDSDSSSKKAKRLKPRSFMDDDDSITYQSQSVAANATPMAPDPAAETSAKKRANDAAAEAAFKAAAEADAARDKEKEKTVKPKASGWLGGWFRGKPEELDSNSSSSGKAAETKVIRAKLGEESSFYYDKDLKKWVNKKDPASMQAGARATPPPPRGPVSRVASVSGGPPLAGSRSMTPISNILAADPSTNITTASLTASPAIGSGSGASSRAATPADGSSGGSNTRPPTSDTVPPSAPPGLGLRPSHPINLFPQGGTASASSTSPAPPSGAGTPPTAIGRGPPSRPSTATPSNSNNAASSSIDDLLGGPTVAGGRRTVKAKKGAKGRYIDVMAK